MVWQAIVSICEIAKEQLVIRGVDFLVGKLNNSGLENLERNFETLKARADDLERDLSIRVGRKRKREVTVWLRNVKRVKREYRKFKEEEQKKGFLKRMFGARKEAIQMNATICDLDEQSRNFGELAVGDDISRGLPRPTARLEGEAFQVNFEKIWNFLENDQVSSIGIHGMGGVGKSTLVEHINNRLLGRNKCVFWVVVSSDGGSIKMLQDKIAKKLELVLLDDDDEGTRAGRLIQALSLRENFVLILDDVWERFNLMRVGVPVEGRKLIITSRSLSVCREMNCQETIYVRRLDDIESWSLFLEKLGGDAKSSLTDPEVEKIGKDMVKICDGLPLGIIALAGAVSGLTEIQEWRHELGKIVEAGWMQEEVFRVLKYSFDRLTHNDQLCFLYCSLYPEDSRIPRKELVRKFISEDLVDKTKDWASQNDEGHSVLTRLVKVSLLESVSDLFSVECVKMHDLVRAMALRITDGRMMVISWLKKIQIEEEWGMDLQKISLMWHPMEEIPCEISPNCPRLSTLLLQGSCLKKGIASSFFSQMCGLHNLDLSHTQIVELPDSLSDLVELTSLLLAFCKGLRKVPCVRKLTKLRELDLSNASSLEDVPQGIEELLNIRYLSLKGAIKLLRTNLVLKSPWLQVLCLPYHIQAELVGGMERLEVFEGWLKDISLFNRLSMSSFLILVSNSGDKFCHIQYLLEGDKNMLTVSKYDFNGAVENKLPIFAEFIHQLEFNSCKGFSVCLLDDLSNPASLRELNILCSKEIECIMTCEQVTAPQESKSRFEALESIKLTYLQDFRSMIYPTLPSHQPPYPPLAFSSLRRLTTSECNRMKKLGLPFSEIEKLEYISIND